MAFSSENLFASASIGIHGRSAVGKEQSADVLAPMLGMKVINTGRLVRGAALMAHTLGQFEEGRGKAIRLRPGADQRIVDWTRSKLQGLHFETRTPDVSAPIFFGDADLTDAIRPRRRGFTNQAIMERAAALIATNPIIRAGLLEVWRDASLSVGGAIMITKNIDEYMPEAHGVFHLVVSDPAVTARYRFRRGIAATRTLESEIAYLRKRDKLHLDNGLEHIPKRATLIDMTPLLLRRNGFHTAARMMVDDLQNKFRSVQD